MQYYNNVTFPSNWSIQWILIIIEGYFFGEIDNQIMNLHGNAKGQK